MVAKVNSGRNISGILNYNENKVKQGVAKCIHENLFGRSVEQLTFHSKLKGLENYLNKNRRATTKVVHISLNFHKSEKLNKETLSEIATSYMDKIGFGNQPYLVYQHFDAAHPHIHIVTTNINGEGKRILLYNIGKNQSEKARKEIEEQFGLVKANGRNQDHVDSLNPIDPLKLTYGKHETKRSISNIVRKVTRSYKYASLPELNAVLRQYNIMADRGSEGSQMQVKKGLLYRVLDSSGKKVGIPIKASSIYGKPTLAYLDKQFKLNSVLKQPHKERLKKCIDIAFKGLLIATKSSFIKELAKENIDAVFRQNEDGRIYGITFVDHKAKIVFNGSDLGKAYGAKAVIERLSELNTTSSKREWAKPTILGNAKDQILEGTEKMLFDLTKVESLDHIDPVSAIKRKRRKKRKGKRL